MPDFESEMCPTCGTYVVDLWKRIDELHDALKPFADYREWARKHEWPADVANDPHTPVTGLDNGGGTLYVRDYDRAALILKQSNVVAK